MGKLTRGFMKPGTRKPRVLGCQESPDLIHFCGRSQSRFGIGVQGDPVLRQETHGGNKRWQVPKTDLLTILVVYRKHKKTCKAMQEKPAGFLLHNYL